MNTQSWVTRGKNLKTQCLRRYIKGTIHELYLLEDLNEDVSSYPWIIRFKDFPVGFIAQEYELDRLVWLPLKIELVKIQPERLSEEDAVKKA
jgi:hypothetical protein